MLEWMSLSGRGQYSHQLALHPGTVRLKHTESEKIERAIEHTEGEGASDCVCVCAYGSDRDLLS